MEPTNINFETLTPAARKGIEKFRDFLAKNTNQIVPVNRWAIYDDTRYATTALGGILVGMILAEGGSLDQALTARDWALEAKNYWITNSGEFVTLPKIGHIQLGKFVG